MYLGFIIMTISVTKESGGQVYLRSPHWKIRETLEQTGTQKISNLEVGPEAVTIKLENNNLLTFSWQELDVTVKNLPIEIINLKDGTIRSGFSVGPDYLSGQIKFNNEGLTTDLAGEVVFRFHQDLLPEI